ncbi:MAG: hypothetical protein H7A23_12450 [Leptospiraceae bacterium]|nr:hypothetical protein [Leptospiraceae bacterium]MCP5495359.1 hypothetical protein [Leptospiraceae bacterium]
MKSKLIFNIIFLLAFCSKDNKICEEAYKDELAGNKSKALYLYSTVLKGNPKHGFANRRTGFLLSESSDSIYVAIYHLEMAKKENPDDLEVATKLIDDYVLAGQLEKMRKMLNLEGEKFPPETLRFLENLYLCITDRKISNDSTVIKSILSYNNPNTENIIYRSKAKCLKRVGLDKEADNLQEKYTNYKVKNKL